MNDRVLVSLRFISDVLLIKRRLVSNMNLPSRINLEQSSPRCMHFHDGQYYNYIVMSIYRHTAFSRRVANMDIGLIKFQTVMTVTLPAVAYFD